MRDEGQGARDEAVKEKDRGMMFPDPFIFDLLPVACCLSLFQVTMEALERVGANEPLSNPYKNIAGAFRSVSP